MDIQRFVSRSSIWIPREIKCNWTTKVIKTKNKSNPTVEDIWHEVELPAQQLATLPNGVIKYKSEDGIEFYAVHRVGTENWHIMLTPEPPVHKGDIVSVFSFYDANLEIYKLDEEPIPNMDEWTVNGITHHGSTKDFHKATEKDFNTIISYYEEKRNGLNSKIDRYKTLRYAAKV